VFGQTSHLSAMPNQLNLGFEVESGVRYGKPARWTVFGEGYEIALDSTAPYAGHRSLRIQLRDSASGRGFGAATMTVAAGTIRGELETSR
jgi:hypothetical protein